ncbi:MAG: endonuclease III [Gammaproteobacteria bacterium]|nr:endonuclease III [Gammaproteobacteria bacterium]
MFARLKAANPEPQTELVYGSPFQLLIAVMLSAQATDRSVNKATKTLFAAAPDAEHMRALGLVGLKRHIASIGLYNTKAANILKTCGQLIEQHGGEVPHDRAALEALPGVGRKTANVVLNTAFGEETIAVDTHIFRVANRLGLAPGRTVREVEDRLGRLVPGPFRRHAHHWLILHGRYVCKARRPLCGQCVLFDLCTYEDRVGLWTATESPPVSTGARSPGLRLRARRSKKP